MKMTTEFYGEGGTMTAKAPTLPAMQRMGYRRKGASTRVSDEGWRTVLNVLRLR